MSDFNIKDTFQKFEEDEFLEAKEELKTFFRTKTNDYLKTELGLQEDPIPVEGE